MLSFIREAIQQVVVIRSEKIPVGAGNGHSAYFLYYNV